MAGDRPEVRVPISTLQRLCGDDTGIVAKLAQSRQIAVRDGTTPLVRGIRAFLDAVRTEARNASLTHARDAARTARAEAAELDLAIDEHALVDDEDASAALAMLCGSITSEISIIAARTSREMAVRRVIEDMLHTTQHEIAAAVGALDGALGPVAKTSRKRKARS